LLQQSGVVDLSEQELIEYSSSRIKELLADRRFQSERYQIRSKALLTQLSPEHVPAIRFTFDEAKIWRNCQYLISSGSRLLTYDASYKKMVLDALKEAAETFEFLSQVTESRDKADALLNAALLYQVAGYQANSICLSRLLSSKTIDEKLPLLELYQHLLLRALRLYLGKRVLELRVRSIEAQRTLKNTEARLIDALRKGEARPEDTLQLAANLHLHNGMKGLGDYCLFGDEKYFQSVTDEAAKSTTLFSNYGDVRNSVIMSVLNTSLTMFHERSTWSTIRMYGDVEDPVWKRYLRILAQGPGIRGSGSSVVEFWESQLHALEKGLITGNKSFIIQMPTSAGKTRVAEIAILDALIKNRNKKCVYVAPFRALATEIERTFAQTLGEVGYRISSVLGTFETDEFQNFLLDETDVLITTPEKLDLLFRSQPEYFEEVCLVVFDEGHIIDEIERGPKFEFLLTKLKRKLRPLGARFIFISAVLPVDNAKEFASWLSNDERNVLATEWRPARQLLSKFEWRENNGWLTFKGVGDPEPFVPGIIVREKYKELTPVRQWEKLVEFPVKGRKSDTAAELAIKFAEQGAVLVFCSIPKWVQSVGETILGALDMKESNGKDTPTYFKKGQRSESLEMAEEWLGSEHVLSSCLKRGIGLHYGSLPEAVRQAVEDDFRSGNLRVLVSTNTLAQGVNLPIKTAIVHSIVRPKELGDRVVLNAVKVRDFWNICGRAGRAGIETEGHIIHIIEKPMDLIRFEWYGDKGNIEPAKSVLLKILELLIEKRISAEDLEGDLDSDLLSILVEEAVSTSDQKLIEEILNDSLVKVQALTEQKNIEPLVEAATTLGERIFQKIENEEQRKLYSSTGLSVDSCLSLDSYCTEHFEELKPALSDSENTTLDKLVTLGWAACSNLAEMKSRYIFQGDTLDCLLKWINLTPMSHMRSEFLSQEETAERLSRFIEDCFVYRLSWCFHAFLRIAAHKIGLEFDQLSLLARYLASMVKFGVNSRQACWARSVGVPTRELAAKMAHAFLQDEPEEQNFVTFFKWFSELSQEDLRNRFGATNFQIRRIMEKTSRINVGRGRVDRLYGKPAPELRFEVRGMQYEDRYKNISGMKIDDVVDLQRDYENEFDANAIKVQYKGKQIGFVERNVARILATEIDLGARVSARVAQLECLGPSLQQTRVKVSVSIK